MTSQQAKFVRSMLAAGFATALLVAAVLGDTRLAPAVVLALLAVGAFLLPLAVNGAAAARIGSRQKVQMLGDAFLSPFRLAQFLVWVAPGIQARLVLAAREQREQMDAALRDIARQFEASVLRERVAERLDAAQRERAGEDDTSSASEETRVA